MSASSSVVTLLAEQNSKTDKSVNCLAEEENKIIEESEKKCALDQDVRRKKRLDWETSPGLKLESNNFDEEQDEVGSLLTGEEIGGETFGIKQERGGLPSIEPGLQVVETSPGKIGRRKGKKDRKVGS